MVFEFIVIIIGLALFEMVTSTDNAVINAEVLSTLPQKMRKWFLSWGIIFAVLLMRGLLPIAIVMLSHPGLGIVEALTFAFDEQALAAFEASTNVLLITGGVFLVFIFLYWLFMEPKAYGLPGEKIFHRFSVWFYAVASVFLLAVIWFAVNLNALMAFGAAFGSTIFFIVHGFRLNAEKIESEIMKSGSMRTNMSDWSKILYLEAIDASFSIDGVIGAFAFTLSVPLIIIGNGFGAVAVRQLTVSNIERIKKYRYLKHGAMYSIFILGIIMIAESFGLKVPSWLAPAITIIILAFFFLKSKKELRINN